jgi:hypothetical protein
MSDITKCKDEICKLKQTCKRYIAKSNDMYQSYFMQSPLTIINDKQVCEFYWELKTEIKNEDRKI